MGQIIEDGKGSINKVEIMEDRLRTFSVQDSLMNHDSVVHKNVFDSRAVTSITDVGVVRNLQSLINFDLYNAILIDRIYINTIASSTTLPNSSTFVTICIGRSGTGGTIINTQNENKCVLDIQPNIQLRTNEVQTAVVGTEMYRVYPELGEVKEMLPQNSDGIILPPGIITGSNNTIQIWASTSNSTTIESFMKFVVGFSEDLI